MTNILYNGPHFIMEIPTEWVATANPRVQVVIYPPGFEDVIPPSYGIMIR